MISSFIDLGISDPILKAIEEMGYDAPTEVQSKAIPHILKQEDLIVRSKTGSGKTAVFGVSMLQLTDAEAPGPQGLILTPTRELAVQVDNDLRQLSKHLNHRTTAVYGKHSMNLEIQAIQKGVSIITGTPGRVFDHIRHGNLKTGHIRFLVLDEADRMLDMGFIDQVEKIIRTLPRDRVTLLFSATIPLEIKKICREYMKNPATIEIESSTKTVDTIKQSYFRVEKNEKLTRLNQLLLDKRPESCMIFCNTKIAVDLVTRSLNRKGYAAQALHGDIPQGKRLKTMQQFKKGGFRLMVATDVAARGIHVDDLSLVINYDVPNERDNYVHRIGRTGRAGNDGQAVSLVTNEDIMSLYEIEEHIGALIEEAQLPEKSDLDKCSAEIDAWIKAHALDKKQIPRIEGAGARKPGRKHSTKSNQRTRSISSRTNTTGGRKEQPDTTRRRKEHNEASRGKPLRSERSGVVKHSPAPNRENQSRTGKASTRNAGRRVHIVHSSDHAKPVYIAAKPEIIHSPVEKEVGYTTSQSEKKPLIKRLVSKILKSSERKHQG